MKDIFMGYMADSMMAFAQPLLDGSDGSPEQMNHALSIAQVCWNIAVLPQAEREESLSMMQSTLKMNDMEFLDFLQSVLIPMVQRHHEMFPNMSEPDSQETAPRPLEKKYPGTGRNAPCPCNSGEKYKRCCGR